MIPSYSKSLPTLSRTCRILAIGCDSETLDVSTTVLRGGGFEVCPATPQQTLRLLDHERFDGVLVCHTLTPRQANAVLALVQALERTIPVIQVYSRTPDPAFRFAAPSYNPSILLSVVGRAVETELRATA